MAWLSLRSSLSFSRIHLILCRGYTGGLKGDGMGTPTLASLRSLKGAEDPVFLGVNIIVYFLS